MKKKFSWGILLTYQLFGLWPIFASFASTDLSIFQYQKFERVGNTLWEKWEIPEEMMDGPPPTPAFFPADQDEGDVGLDQDRYYYDCSVPFSDNDQRATACARYKGETVTLAWKSLGRFRYHHFEEISAALSPEIERIFDLIFIANTAPNNQPGLIPGQHLLVVKRNSQLERPKSIPLFTRGPGGTITGISSSALPLSKIIPRVQLEGAGRFTKVNNLELIPISSGAIAKGSIDTFSGIFQLNWRKSQNQLATSWQAPMSYSLFVGYLYGKESGVAIHGTPAKNWGLLGQRASHGCLRVHPHYGQQFYQLVQSMAAHNLPLFNWNHHLPTLTERKVDMRPVLIVLFKGYAKRKDDIQPAPGVF